MKRPIPETLALVCREILKINRTEAEWGEIESDDMFQTEDCIGGYDADERAFCFSYYEQGREYWFQISLDQVSDIVNESTTTVNMRLNKVR